MNRLLVDLLTSRDSFLQSSGRRSSSQSNSRSCLEILVSLDGFSHQCRPQDTSEKAWHPLSHSRQTFFSCRTIWLGNREQSPRASDLPCNVLTWVRRRLSASLRRPFISPQCGRHYEEFDRVSKHERRCPCSTARADVRHGQFENDDRRGRL